MKEKELRLAVVCYGGVSLAIYQHGVTKEILKLVRASKAFHSTESTAEKQTPAYTFPALAGDDAEHDTEAVYFDLLKAIGVRLDLRVIVDVIAGSSAGGLNGVALARALAHDLSLAPLTSMWLAEADMGRLLAPDARAHAWSKWYFRPIVKPLLWGLGREGVIPPILDEETRRSLSVFLRSRWFKPPLDGRRLTNMMLDALHAMAAPAAGAASLIPTAQRLDLVVTVTDFHGAERAIFIHDPPVVMEREHRHLLRFRFERPDSDFDAGGLPGLAFAARATASYPGAFPPMQLAELDSVLAERDEPWPDRPRFLAENFRHYRERGLDPAKAILLDGSILNNKPIFAALEAVRAHRAYREVDRRLVYIDPHPRGPALRPERMPGFFRTLRGALSDLPRQEPIYEELIEIDALNKRVRRMRAAVAAARPHVEALVDRATRGRLRGRVRPEDLRRWRLNEGNLLARVGLVYNNWIALMVAEATEFAAGLLATICGYTPDTPEARWLEAVVEAWTRASGVFPDNYVMPPGVAREADLPPFGAFIVNFGVGYRRRRLAFVIQAINDLYARVSEPQFAAVTSTALDLLKHRLYRSLDALRVYDGVEFLSDDLTVRIRALFQRSADAGVEMIGMQPDAFVAARRAAMDAVMGQVSRECDLVGSNEEVDSVLASPSVLALGPEAQREVLLTYLGFIFWDIVLLPMSGGLHLDTVTLEEVLVDRISPNDVATIALESDGPVLRGGSFAGFGGFFSRTIRENDYLWGRLNAVDRLLDLVASTASPAIREGGIDVRGFKKRAFEAILETEAPRLGMARDLIGRLQAVVARL